jgi:tetratricopeptide (TPR) repeat protein
VKDKRVEVEIDGQMRVLSQEEAEALLRQLVAKARNLLEAGDLSEAKRKCALALTIDDEDVGALELFGDVAKAEGDTEVSEAVYQAAYESSGRSPTLLMKLLAENLKRGELSRAEEYAVELIRAAPQIRTGWKNLTEIQIAEERLDEAAATLHSWLSQLGESDETQYYAAVLAWLKGDRQRAYEQFRALAERGTRLADVYHYLAVYHYDREECAEVVPSLKKYLELNGPDEEAEEVLQECLDEISKRG